MKKSRLLGIAGYIALLILAGVLLVKMCKMTKQAMSSFVVKTKFVGEYSLDGNEWKTLEKNTKFSSFDGDLMLRGQLDEQLPMYLSFYLNHIGVTISVNGERVFDSGRVNDDVPEMVCGSYWSGWSSEEVKAVDEIQIRLHNPHKYGNAGAYNEFLDSLYFGGGMALQKQLHQMSMPYQITGMFIMVVSVALLGMALGYLVQRISSGSLLWSMGLMSLFMSGYILMDTIDNEFRSNLIVFNTCMRLFCILFGSLELANCIRKILTGKRCKIAGYFVAMQATVNGILVLLSLIDIIDVYDISLYWAISQGIVFLAMFGLCVLEYLRGVKEERILSVSCMTLIFVVLFELVNARVNFCTSGIIVKVIFTMLFLFYLVSAVKLVVVNHEAAIKAKKLESELTDSRIVLAMSQIQPHFIYNALGAIRSLCVEDSRTAVEAIDRFSGYLRGSFEAMDKKQCIPFHKEMELVDNYLYLEQRRFEDKIKIEKSLETENFMLPPMSVQPIVENAVRHGIRGKRTAGTVIIKSFADEAEYIIIVADDGVGFDISEMKKDGKVHVGLQNVEKRLNLMCKGRLEVESVPGEGTTVIIHIPKNLKKTDEKKGQKIG